METSTIFLLNMFQNRRKENMRTYELSLTTNYVSDWVLQWLFES